MKLLFKNFENILKTKKGTASAVILAAGDAERFGRDKLTACVDGIPVLVRSVSAFEDCPLIDEIILVARNSDKATYAELLKKYDFVKLKKIVSGGDKRQKSALLGFEAINPKATYTAIHDAARCLITPNQIEAVLRCAYESRAASAAYRLTDTLKYSDGKGHIEYTIDRERAWGVTTPQIFLSDLYRAAAYTARDAEYEATDDCMLAERVGFTVSLCDIGSDNIKVTYPSDISRAEEILSRRISGETK